MNSHFAKFSHLLFRILRSFRIYEFALCEYSHFAKFSHLWVRILRKFAFCEVFACENFVRILRKFCESQMGSAKRCECEISQNFRKKCEFCEFRMRKHIPRGQEGHAINRQILMTEISCDGRVVKARDWKSLGVSPRRFESCSQRTFWTLFVWFDRRNFWQSPWTCNC